MRRTEFEAFGVDLPDSRMDLVVNEKANHGQTVVLNWRLRGEGYTLRCDLDHSDVAGPAWVLRLLDGDGRGRTANVVRGVREVVTGRIIGPVSTARSNLPVYLQLSG